MQYTVDSTYTIFNFLVQQHPGNNPSNNKMKTHNDLILCCVLIHIAGEIKEALGNMCNFNFTCL